MHAVLILLQDLQAAQPGIKVTHILYRGSFAMVLDHVPPTQNCMRRGRMRLVNKDSTTSMDQTYSQHPSNPLFRMSSWKLRLKQ